ncbi:MAG TPA: hemerythrin domain-containing protein [Nitrospiria bacterium]
MGEAIEQLKKEHEAIKKMLLILEKVCEKIEKGEKVHSKHLTQILEFFKIFADKCHHGKEEEILFPSLEYAGIPKEGGPLGVMLNEHELMRGYVRGWEGAFENYQKGDPEAPKKILQFAVPYISTLRLHIDKENNVLFRMAEMHLSIEEEKELMERFEKTEIEKIGKGKHEEFHRVLEHLEEIYL